MQPYPQLFQWWPLRVQSLPLPDSTSYRFPYFASCWNKEVFIFLNTVLLIKIKYSDAGKQWNEFVLFFVPCTINLYFICEI